MKKSKFLIIGAGPTGLGAAYALRAAGVDDFRIIEAGEFIGGLAASFRDPAGFTWDVGGHVQFSHYPLFDQAMHQVIPAEEWLHHQRESWVWIHNRFVPYPFQNNIRYLPREALWSCLKGLLQQSNRTSAGKPSNFEEWIRRSFGDGLAHEFMLPYNFKVWAYPPQELAYQWIGDRVATVDIERILENIIFEKMDASWGPNSTFQFPLRGGTGEIWRRMGELVGLDHISLNRKVVGISAHDRRLFLSTGETIGYEHLLSTMPLDRLAQMVPEIPPSVRRAASQLRHSASNIVGIGVRGEPHPDLATKCWMYFPEGNTPFYRMTVFSNYSPNNVPDPGCYSLMCETSESPAKHVDRAALVDQTIAGLQSCGFLSGKEQIASRWQYTAEYGYPTPCTRRDAILAEVIPALERIGVFSRGRFGGWKYEVSNQDHSFMQGVEWVERIVHGTAESTYRVDTAEDPNVRRLRKTSVGAKVPVNGKIPHYPAVTAARPGSAGAAES